MRGNKKMKRALLGLTALVSVTGVGWYAYAQAQQHLAATDSQEVVTNDTALPVDQGALAQQPATTESYTPVDPMAARGGELSQPQQLSPELTARANPLRSSSAESDAAYARYDADNSIPDARTIATTQATEEAGDDIPLASGDAYGDPSYDVPENRVQENAVPEIADRYNTPDNGYGTSNNTATTDDLYAAGNQNAAALGGGTQLAPSDNFPNADVALREPAVNEQPAALADHNAGQPLASPPASIDPLQSKDRYAQPNNSGSGAGYGTNDYVGTNNTTTNDYAANNYLSPAPATAAAVGSGRPGAKQLEGPQSPTLSLEKRAPAEVQVGSPAVFEIVVRNTGSIAAEDVTVVDVVPEGAQLMSTTPQAETSGGRVLWSLGRIAAGDEQVLKMQIVPTQEGEMGSVASLSYRMEASARTMATKPVLQLEMTAPRSVLIGEDVALNIRVTNTGSGAAKDVLLYQALPPQLKHVSGSELEYDIGTLLPGDSRSIELVLEAAAPGQANNVLVARAEGNVAVESSAQLEVVAPALQVSLDGPRRRYLERQATYTLSVNNPGTAPAKDIELVSHLPQGMKFVSANNQGEYDDKTHSVYWSLAELSHGDSGSVQLVIVPTEEGQHRLTAEGTADLNLSDSTEEVIAVEGLAAILFEVVDVADPIEVGGETTYEIRVVNQGTKTASNIRIAALIPQGLEAIDADGPVRYVSDAGRVIFEPLPRLAPKADTSYRIRVRGTSPGDQRLRVQLTSDDTQTPVTKEESTRVYSDR